MLAASETFRKPRPVHYAYSISEWKQGAAVDRIQAVRLFIRVVDLGSFSKAAADLGIGQPSATKLVAQLEAKLGSRLLHRSTHGVAPTEIGALYYDKCKLIAHHVDEAETVASLLQSQVQGDLRINTSVAFGRRVLVPLVMRFMRAHPKLKIELSFDDRYMNLVEHGIDVAIRMGRLADSSLGASYLGLNPWMVVASADYLAARGMPLKPADLAKHDALIYSTVQGDARWQFSGTLEAKKTGRKKAELQSVVVRGPLRSNNLSALLAAARGGMGVAALPSYVAFDSVRSGTVQAVLTDWALPVQEIHAVFPSPRLVPAKVSGFVAWLQTELGENWWMHAA
jgi:DNA-binding transcriptional LysR family regulator